MTYSLDPPAARSATPRLTELSHGGGCGCKIAPALLSEILKRSGVGRAVPAELLVGFESSDDAAVYRLNDEQALVATTDFFMPIVDDPVDFGRIAAANAISDIYAMGAKPILALALVAMPVDRLAAETIAEILRGGETVCAAAGIPVAGGHTIDSVEPIYGLVVLGIVHPSKVRRNASAREGAVLVLGKPLGVGVLSAAFKKGLLDAAGYLDLINTTTQLNTPGPDLADLPDVHALTDVTGFGLAGHLLEMARGAQLCAKLRWDSIPLLPQVQSMAADGLVTGASLRNWSGYGNSVVLDPNLPPVAKELLTDPQTSGGLLVSCASSAAESVLRIFRRHGFESAAVVGHMESGSARVEVHR